MEVGHEWNCSNAKNAFTTVVERCTRKSDGDTALHAEYGVSINQRSWFLLYYMWSIAAPSYSWDASRSRESVLSMTSILYSEARLALALLASHGSLSVCIYPYGYFTQEISRKGKIYHESSRRLYDQIVQLDLLESENAQKRSLRDIVGIL